MTVPESPAVDETPPIDPSEQLELKLPDESSEWRDLGLWAGVLVLLVLVAFWPGVAGRFQWLDDRAVSRDLSLARPGGLGEMWADRWSNPAGYRFPAYVPVAFTADWVAYRLGGHDEQGRPTPTAYHVVALACQSGAAVLAWLVLRELAVPAAWLVAAVFAVHPVNAQPLSWISEGGATVGGLMFFGSAYAYVGYQRFRDRDVAERLGGGAGGDPAQTWGVYAAAALLAILAGLAFPAAGAVPAVLMLALWWRRRLGRIDVLLLAPVLGVTAILWLSNLWLPRPGEPGGLPPAAGLSPAGILAAVGSGLEFAALKVIAPVPLKLLYSTGLGGGWAALAAAVVVLGVVPALVYARTGGRGLLAAAGAFAVGVVPALNWFDPRRHGVLSDSTAYLATVPVAALVLAGVAAGLRRRAATAGHTQAVVIASAVLLVVLAGTAWARAHVFETPVSLWQDTTAKAPRSAFAATQLGEALRQRSAEDAAVQDADATQADLTAAAAEAARAADLADAAGDPVAAAAAQRTWAAALVGTGDAQGSLPHFALATGPQAPADAATAGTLVQYGQTLLTLGLRARAVAELDRALAADPTSSAAHRVLGRAYHELGDAPRFLIEEQKAVELDPSDYAGEQLYADALVDAGRLGDAADRYLGLLTTPDKANQGHADLWAALGRTRLRQGVFNDAVTALAQAQQLDPKLPDIDRDLADARAKLKVAAATRPAMTQPTTAPAASDPPVPGP